MKKLVFTLLLSAGVSCLFGQEHFKYYRGEKDYLNLSPNKVIVQFPSNMETETIKSIMENICSERATSIAWCIALRHHINQINHSSDKMKKNNYIFAKLNLKLIFYNII